MGDWDAKPERYIIPALIQLLELKTQSQLAKKMGVDDSYLVRLTSAKYSDHLSIERIDQLIGFARDIAGVKFERAHFKASKEKFVEAISRDHTQYSAVREVAGLPSLPEPEERLDGFIELLYGKFTRLFLCKNPDNPKTDAVALNDFEIT